MNPSDGDSDELPDMFFTPFFGVSADLETGIMGVEHLVTCESINGPLDQLDEVIDNLIKFQKTIGNGDTDVDSIIAPTLEISYESIRENVLIRDLVSSIKLPFKIERFDELIEQLFEFRHAHVTGNCR